MPFRPGQSGNPNGRPKKERALTAILERAGGKTIEVDGKNVSGRQLIARMVWEGVTTGQVSFPDGASLKLSPTDWKDFVKWIYTQVDGPPKAEVDITTNDESINRLEIGVKVIDYRNTIAALAPGSVSDSDTSGENEDPDDGPTVG